MRQVLTIVAVAARRRWERGARRRPVNGHVGGDVGGARDHVAGRRDDGQATAELAMGLPTLGTVLVLAVWVLGAVSAQARCTEAARIGARMAARGENAGQVLDWARRAAPGGATVVVEHRPGEVIVTVRAAFPAGASRLPTVPLAATAVAPVEEPVVEAGDAPHDGPASGPGPATGGAVAGRAGGDPAAAASGGTPARPTPIGPGGVTTGPAPTGPAPRSAPAPAPTPAPTPGPVPAPAQVQGPASASASASGRRPLPAPQVVQGSLAQPPPGDTSGGHAVRDGGRSPTAQPGPAPGAARASGETP